MFAIWDGGWWGSARGRLDNQLMATQSILTKANREILKAHIGGCVQEAFDSGDEKQREASMQEILSLLDKLGR